MVVLVKLIAILIIAIGIVFLLNPKALKQYAAFWTQGKRIYMGGILNLLFGVLFLSVASQCRLGGVMIVMGIISLAKGAMIFISGPEKMKAMLSWWSKKRPAAARGMALVAIGIGALLLYSI